MTIKQKYKKETNRLVHQIQKRYKPKKIFLYGSCAKGKINGNSDIDMLIIKDTKRRFIDRISDVLMLCDYELPFEPLVYTPGELSKCKKQGDYFIIDILQKGKLVYEKE